MIKGTRLAGLNALLAIMIAFAGFAGMVTTTSAQETASVTIRIDSSDRSAADRMAPGSTWSVTSVDNPELSVSGEFNEEHLAIPGEIPVTNQIPFGQYTIVVEAGDAFERFERTVSVNEPKTFIMIMLDPVEDEDAPEPVLVGVTVDAGESGLDALPAGSELIFTDSAGNFVDGADLSGAELPVVDVMFNISDWDDDEYTVGIDVLGVYASFTVEEGVAVPDVVTLSLPALDDDTPGEPVFAESLLTVTGPDAGTWETYNGSEISGEPIASGTFEGGVAVSLGDYLEGETYAIQVAAEGWDSAVTTFVGGEHLELALTQDEEPVMHQVMITATTPDEGSAEGAPVYIESLDDNGVQTFMQVAAEPNGTLNADNSFSTELEAGAYSVTIDATLLGYGVTTVTFNVPTDAPVVVALEAADVELGLVHIHNFVCDGIDEVIFGDDADAVGEGCEPAAGTFTFYLYGDGTNEYTQVKVDNDGVLGVQLLAGTYEVVVEENQAKVDIDVVTGETTELVVQSPAAAAEGPGEGDNDSDAGEENGEAQENESEVTELPKTGTGHEANSLNMALMLSAAAAVTATAGGFVVRHKRG